MGDESVAEMQLRDITGKSVRATFASYAEAHEAASVGRCWSTWNVLCACLFTSELSPANPVTQIARLKVTRHCPLHYLPALSPRSGVR